MARGGCGVASSQRATRRTSRSCRFLEKWWPRYSTKVTLLISLTRGHPGADFCQAAFAQSDHAFFASDALDFGSGPAVHDHFADAIASSPATRRWRCGRENPCRSIPGSRRLRTNTNVGPCGRIESRFCQFGQREFLGRLQFAQITRTRRCAMMQFSAETKL